MSQHEVITEDPYDHFRMSFMNDIKNWAASVRPAGIKRTTIKTYILDPAAVSSRQFQISNYEPDRVRMKVIPVDAPIALTMESPVQSPDPGNLASLSPQGGFLPATPLGYEFFGPDAWYVNSILAAAVTRVTVIKEYA